MCVLVCIWSPIITKRAQCHFYFQSLGTRISLTEWE